MRFFYTLGFPIFIRGIDYIIAGMCSPWHGASGGGISPPPYSFTG